MATAIPRCTHCTSASLSASKHQRSATNRIRHAGGELRTLALRCDGPPASRGGAAGRTHDEAMPLIDGTPRRHPPDRRQNAEPACRPAKRCRDWILHTLGANTRAGCAGFAVDPPCRRRMARHRSGHQGERRAHRRARRQLGHGRHAASASASNIWSRIFRLHRDAHVNMIRNWMGQDTEESFYALADKYGLMVWNDFWESTQNYNLEAAGPGAVPQERARYDSALSPSSIDRGVVRAQRGRAAAHHQRGTRRIGAHARSHALLHRQLEPGESAQLRARTSGSRSKPTYRINRGFSVELGIPSVPTLESLESFIPEPDRWPISDTWAYHDWHQSGNGARGALHGAHGYGVRRAHQPRRLRAQGADARLRWAIAPSSKASPRIFGSPTPARMIWMTQPAWPSMEWNFLSWDYDTQSSFYGTQKGLRAGARAAQSRRSIR